MKLELDGERALVTGSTAASDVASGTNGSALRVDGGVIRAILR